MRRPRRRSGSGHRPVDHQDAARRWGVEVSGREHIPLTGPVILASNHMAILDGPIMIAVRHGRSTRW